MLVQEPNGTWWLKSELGPEDCPPPRQITDAEAARWLNDHRSAEAKRLNDIQRAQAPDYYI